MIDKIIEPEFIKRVDCYQVVFPSVEILELSRSGITKILKTEVDSSKRLLLKAIREEYDFIIDQL